MRMYSVEKLSNGEFISSIECERSEIHLLDKLFERAASSVCPCCDTHDVAVGSTLRCALVEGDLTFTVEGEPLSVCCELFGYLHQFMKSR